MSAANSATAKTAVAVAMIAGFLTGGALLAGATSYDPTSDLTNLANSTGSQLGPIVVAVVTALIGIVILFWGVRFVMGLVHRGGRAGR